MRSIWWYGGEEDPDGDDGEPNPPTGCGDN